MNDDLCVGVVPLAEFNCEFANSIQFSLEDSRVPAQWPGFSQPFCSGFQETLFCSPRDRSEMEWQSQQAYATLECSSLLCTVPWHNCQVTFFHTSLPHLTFQSSEGNVLPARPDPSGTKGDEGMTEDPSWLSWKYLKRQKSPCSRPVVVLLQAVPLWVLCEESPPTGCSHARKHTGSRTYKPRQWYWDRLPKRGSGEVPPVLGGPTSD